MKSAARKPKKKNFNLRKWSKTLAGQQFWLIILFTVIPLTLLITFTYVPFAEMVKFSFYDLKYATPPADRKFVGWQNYIDLFKRKDTIRAFALCLYYMAGAIIQLVLALYLATILSFKVKLGNLFKGIMFFPYLINGIAIGFIFKFFFTRGFVFDSVLQKLGYSLEDLPYWLKDQAVNNWSLVGTSVWRYFGQNMVLFIGSIMSIDSSLFEAAEIDGANKFKQFHYIILPEIRTIFTLNVILAITGSLSAFEQPFVITGGANGTATYFIIMNNLAHNSQKLGLASAMAVVLFLIIIAVTGLQKLFFKYVFREAESETVSYKTAQAQRKRQRQEQKQKRKNK